MGEVTSSGMDKEAKKSHINVHVKVGVNKEWGRSEKPPWRKILPMKKPLVLISLHSQSFSSSLLLGICPSSGRKIQLFGKADSRKTGAELMRDSRGRNQNHVYSQLGRLYIVNSLNERPMRARYVNSQKVM